MPASLPTRSSLLHFAKWMLLAIGLTACIWIGVILWWRSNPREITPGDVFTYLVILPIAALAAISGIRWLRTRKRNSETSAMPIGASATANSQDQMSPANPASDGLPIISAWCVTSSGTSLDELRTALIEKRTRPHPDPDLRDDDGFPLHAARVQELDTSDTQHALHNIILNNAMLSPLQGGADREGCLRSLALLSLLLHRLATEWPLREDHTNDAAMHQAAATLRGNAPAESNAGLHLHLQIKLIISADFSPSEKQLALTYLLQSSSLLPFDSERMHIEIVPARDEPAAMLLAEHFRAQSLHADQPQALLLLACDSALCQVTTGHWQSEHKLFGSHTPQGLMPGEAAFAILCINQSALHMALEQPACLLHRVVQGRRNTSADNGGKVSHATLGELAGTAIADAGMAGETIGAIACDADHRSSRVLECIGTMLEHAPHLDAVGDRLSLNEICGHTGAATSAGSWVAGIAQARETGSPTLLLCLSHAFERAAALLLPADVPLESTRIV